MRKVQLGDLGRGQVFRFQGRRYEVRKNLGAAGVSIRSAATRQVTVGERTFTAHANSTEVWSAASPVEVEE
jgi:hypothetical protein